MRTSTAPERSRLMASVRQSQTDLELHLASTIGGCGVDYEVNAKGLPGSPDFANRSEKWAIFANGCFWHAHPGCSLATTPKSNTTFWRDKFRRNQKRDEENVKELEGKGYSILTVWQCELKDESLLKNKINTFLEENRLNHRETYQYSKSRLSVRLKLRLENGRVHSILVRNRIPEGKQVNSARDAFDYSYLRSKSRPIWNRINGQPVRIVDMFCGCGGMTLGFVEACRALQLNWHVAAAIDTEPDCLEVFRRNIPSVKTYEQDVMELINGNLGEKPTIEEREFLNEIGAIDILLAGPPCQGYSDLNNYTRRRDERNLLYERVARFVELVQPTTALIENVPAVRHGKEKALQRAQSTLKKIGYCVDSGVVDLSELGVPQRRRRHLMVASKRSNVNIRTVISRFSVDSPRSVRWAIGDLDGSKCSGVFDSPSDHSDANLKRMRYLINGGFYRLPNRMRPDCHKSGNHSYGSVYGRLDWERPAQTITGGFGSPGQGRFVHPSQPRTLTPHEAARLQFFPDFYDFSSVRKRTVLAEMIGNAVPMKLPYVICLELLSQHSQNSSAK